MGARSLMDMRIIFDPKTVLKDLAKVEKGNAKDAVSALNRAATASKKRVDKALANITGAKATRVKKLSKVIRARVGGGTIRMQSKIIWYGKKLGIYGLSKGKVKVSSGGATVKLKGGNRSYPKAFVATVNKGRYTGLFKRKTSGTGITEIMMDANPTLFETEGLGKDEEKLSMKDVDKFYDIAVKKRVDKFNAGR